MRIEPARSLRPVTNLIKKTNDPAHRAMLENFREHLATEMTGDLDRLMATLSDHPIYRSYEQGADIAAVDLRSVAVDGRDAVRALYTSLVASGRNAFELDSQRLAVADWGIAGDGFMYMTEKGADLITNGVTSVAADTTYITASRFAYFLPYEDGKIAGEDFYLPSATTKYIPVAEEDLWTMDDIVSAVEKELADS